MCPAALSPASKRTQAAPGWAHCSSAKEGRPSAGTGRVKLGRQRWPPSVERHTLVPLVSQPSFEAVKQTDCGGAGAASAVHARPPSVVCTSVVWRCGPSAGRSFPPATPQPWVRLAKWTCRSGPTLGWPSWRQCWPPSTVPSRMPSPSAQPVRALTKSTPSSSWAPCQNRAQVRPPLLVARIVPVPTAKAVAVPPISWTPLSRLTCPRGRVVVGAAGVLAGGLAVGCGVVGGGANDTGVGAAAGRAVVEWAVQPVTATAAANKTVVMIRTGRMATSPKQQDLSTGPQQLHGSGRSRHSDGRASPQWRKGLDPAAIVNRNQHARLSIADGLARADCRADRA